MARLVIVLVLAAVVLGVAGLASAETAAIPTSGGGEVHRGDTASEAAAAALPSMGPTTSDDQIGTDDDGDTALSPNGDTATAASVGGDAPPGAYGTGSTDHPNGASALEVAGVATVAAIAGCFFF